jgi:hypothetical protein
VSQQAYGRRGRILEAEAFAQNDPRICEALQRSFAALNGGLPLADPDPAERSHVLRAESGGTGP